ncbi:hypothetical protein [Microvirga pakistanensis]|uniref:hypothetical protein n=1 Tax=Microvirga pakistanensis TaxID=1682650 RepID=UPI00141B0654|nr:hypothetical protein [Microvirga pakistanensis]
MAITAVAAGFFRRGVVVDIINWPVSLYFVRREASPRAGNTRPNLIGVLPRLYKLSPSLQTARTNREAIFNRRGVLVTFCRLQKR